MSARGFKSGLIVAMVVAMAAMLTSCSPQQKVSIVPPPGVNAGADGKPAPFQEPVRLSSKDGVLEVRLSAHQGTVRVWSSGSALDGQSITYLEDPNDHGGNVDYRQTASFAPFAGASPGLTVATTSTTYGADLLVAGMTPAGAEVCKYSLSRAAPDAKSLAEKLIATLPVPGVNGPAPLGGR